MKIVAVTFLLSVIVLVGGNCGPSKQKEEDKIANVINN
jgi:hypothetical protein